MNRDAAGCRRCRACDAADLARRCRIRGYGILACSACGSWTTASRMNGADASRFYDSDYFHGGDYLDYPSSETVLKKNAAGFVRRLRRFGEGGRMLELGCAYGFFLDVASAYWDMRGVDVSPAAIESCSKRHGERVVRGEASSVPFSGETFDWTVGWDMIEHVDSPRLTVMRCAELLKPGGRAAFTTGDVSSLAARLAGNRWRLLTPPSHLTFFSREGMKRMLGDAGFVDVEFTTAGYHRSLSFAVFRLLGPEAYRLIAAHPAIRRLMQSAFYLNLGDIMFVTARKPT